MYALIFVFQHYLEIVNQGKLHADCFPVFLFLYIFTCNLDGNKKAYLVGVDFVARFGIIGLLCYLLTKNSILMATDDYS